MIKRQTTVQGLTANSGFLSLADHGLFNDRMPHCFTSKGLSKHITQNMRDILAEKDEKELRKTLAKTRHDFIRYDSLRDVNVPRQLGVPHPESHLLQCLVIEHYWQQIKCHCSKPAVPASRTFVRKMVGDRVFHMNYKGKDRDSLEERDLRGMVGSQYVVKADISACYPSIYTHSIPWAMHGKTKAKKNRGFSLPGNLLDSVTQGTRDGQTNGLLIGPDTSSVISEIILTKIDAMMQSQGYKQFTRYIDDYTFYAQTHEEAEQFVHHLGLILREYELVLNERKTSITPMPRAIEAEWVRELQSFSFSNLGPLIDRRTVRNFLDLALDLSAKHGSNRVLNYAFKMIPENLSGAAKRFVVLQAVNLAVLYPYLAPILKEYVFQRHQFTGIRPIVHDFIVSLVRAGIRKVHPDAIAHGLYYSLSYRMQLPEVETKFLDVVDMGDCLTNILLLEYARLFKASNIRPKVRVFTDSLQTLERREKDRYWLLIYQMWDANKLNCEGQTYLAQLRKSGFQFVVL